MVYKESEKMKMLNAKDFFWVLDKESGASLVWGKTQDDEPKFDPFGPEKMVFMLDESYVFQEDVLKKLFNIKYDKEEYKLDESQNMSTLSMVYLDYSGKKITKEADKLLEFLQKNGMYASWIFKTSGLTLKDVLSVSSRKIKFAVLKTASTEGLKDSIDLCLSNSVYPEVILETPVEKINNILDFLCACPPLVPVEIRVDSGRIEEVKDKVSVADAPLAKVVSRDFSEGGRYSCIADFKEGIVYPDEMHKKTSQIKLDKVEYIDDFWNSQEFSELREEN